MHWKPDMQKRSPLEGQSPAFASPGRPPRPFCPQDPCSDVSLLLGICHHSSGLSEVVLGSSGFCREGLWVTCQCHAITYSFFLPWWYHSSHGNKSSEVKYHSSKQLSLGQHEARYPIRELVCTKQAHSSSSPQSPCVMSTCRLPCVMAGDLLSLGCSSFAHVLSSG